MNNFFDTICAIATPMSMGSIGVIRVSGEHAFDIVQKIFSKKIKPKMINHGWIVKNNQKFDEVIVLPFVSPNSFTGEDVVEIQTHGSPVILREILGLVIEQGARHAQRGEFSKRAFLNHKIDMTQAEAILNLIHAKTSKSAQAQANNLSGMLSLKINEIKSDITEIFAKITASIDFPEDVSDVPYEEIEEKLNNAKNTIQNILKSAHAHNVIREGIKISIIGNVNVGKSSLFNALLNINRAIVTDIEGTTRDAISETLDINGLCATIIDTAGIRESSDVVEQIGIDNAKQYAKDADLVLCLFDGSLGLTKEDEEIFKTDKPSILVGTKKDIKPCENKNVINISSKTKDGIEELKEEIYNKILGFNQLETEFSTNQRQQDCLKKALESLENAISACEVQELQDLILIDIKSALLSLDEITGEVLTDNILNDIFEKFCIGK